MKIKQREIFYSITQIVGLILIIWEIPIYQNTIIDLKILIGIILTVAIIVFIIDIKNFEKTYSYSKTKLYIYSLIHYISGFGFIACSIFILTNFYFAESEFKKEKYKIEARSSIPGRKYRRLERQPTFEINYKEERKELVFPHRYYNSMNLYNYIEMEVRKGYLGFDVLENKTLIK